MGENMRHRIHHRSGALVGSVVLALGLAAGSGTPALASLDDKLAERTDTTYRLMPDEGRVHVESVVTLSNKAKPTTRRGPCKNRNGTCTIKTRYYYTGWGKFWTPVDAANVRIGGPNVTALPAEAVGDGLAYAVTFPKLWNKKGAKQRATIAFDVPAGTVETTDRPTRVEEAYAFFCWWGMASDSGTTRAVLPAGWEVVTDDDVVVEMRPDATVVTAASKANPTDFIECMEAYDPAGLERTYVAGVDGKSLVVVEAWPGHEAWADDMATVAAAALTTLESTMGTPMPRGELRFREASNQAREHTWADARPLDGVVGISEHVGADGYVPAILARTWIDPSHFTDTWLGEGIALWLGAQANTSTSCPEAVEHPGPGPADLDDWQPDGSDSPVRSWQSASACHIVEIGAEIIGTEAMLELIRELVEAPVPVGTSHWLAGVSRELPAGLDRLTAALDESGLDH